MSEWVEEEETVSERLIPVDNSIYDNIVVQSETEKKFVEKLKKMKNVRLFIKAAELVQSGNARGPIQPGLGLGDDLSRHEHMEPIDRSEW